MKHNIPLTNKKYTEIVNSICIAFPDIEYGLEYFPIVKTEQVVIEIRLIHKKSNVVLFNKKFFNINTATRRLKFFFDLYEAFILSIR